MAMYFDASSRSNTVSIVLGYGWAEEESLDTRYIRHIPYIPRSALSRSGILVTGS